MPVRWWVFLYALLSWGIKANIMVAILYTCNIAQGIIISFDFPTMYCIITYNLMYKICWVANGHC